MNLGRLVVFVAWSLTVLLVTGFFVFVFTFGDCMDEAACAASKNRAFWTTLGTGFFIYWAVTIALLRRWSR